MCIEFWCFFGNEMVLSESLFVTASLLFIDTPFLFAILDSVPWAYKSVWVIIKLAMSHFMGTSLIITVNLIKAAVFIVVISVSLCVTYVTGTVLCHVI